MPLHYSSFASLPLLVAFPITASNFPFRLPFGGTEFFQATILLKSETARKNNQDI